MKQTEASRRERGHQRVTLRLNPDRLDELSEMADFRGLSRTQLLNKLIADAWANRATNLPGNRT